MKKTKQKNKVKIRPADSDVFEILKRLEQSKKAKAEVKRVVKKKAKVEKVEVDKPRKAKDKLIAFYDSKRAYEAGLAAVDYDELYSYLGKENKAGAYKAESLMENDRVADTQLTEEELETIIRREQTNAMIRNSYDPTTVEEKEKYKAWKTVNRLWNMIKIDMCGVGNTGAANFFYV